MISKLQLFRSRYVAFRQMIAPWIERHWVKVLGVLFCAYLAAERNLTVQLELSTSRPAIALSREIGDQAVAASPKATGVALHNAIDPAAQEAQRAYVQRFKKVAQAEMEKFGIPASIKLAQGLLESQAGNSPLASRNNNHFGIKCFSRQCKKGHCRNFEDDSHKDFFRIYQSAWESYRAHSLLLKQKERYEALFTLPSDDYRGWAQGLAKAGYATDPAYAQKLIRLIEGLQLQRFDRPV
jgi:flagellum-specific peptidoglycan hydrolase FlgJ